MSMSIQGLTYSKEMQYTLLLITKKKNKPKVLDIDKTM